MASSNGRLKLVKRNSRAQVTLGVRRHGPISRVQLARVTGLSLTCVCDIVDELLSEGTLIESGTIAGQRGRPQVLLSINPNGHCAAGVWLAPEAVEIVVARPTTEVVARKTISYTAGEDSPEAVVRVIVQGIQRCAESAGIDAHSLKGVGVSVAGLVDPVLGAIDDLTNRRGWEGVPIVRILSEQLEVPVVADNDVRAAALASLWFGDESREGGALYLTVGEGIGAAVVYSQEIMRGVHDTAGLIGHMTIDPDGPACGCGKRGCLEALASDISFIRYIWPNMARDAVEMTSAERVELVRQGMELALEGDAGANWALVTVTRYLGIGIANAVSVLDPQVVHVGGTLIDLAPDKVIDLIRREAVQHVWRQARGVDIRPLPHYDEFLLRGSIGLVLAQPYRTLQEDNFTAKAVRDVKALRPARTRV